jgi:hypothetical protein
MHQQIKRWEYWAEVEHVRVRHANRLLPRLYAGGRWRPECARHSERLSDSQQLGLWSLSLSRWSQMSGIPNNLSAVRVGADPAGRWRIGVFAKRTWTVECGVCELADGQVPLVEEPQVDSESGVLHHDTDVMLRTRADVIVLGHAYSTGGASSFEASVRIGANLARSTRVNGPRRVERDPFGRLRFTPPKSVDKVASLGRTPMEALTSRLVLQLETPSKAFNSKLGSQRIHATGCSPTRAILSVRVT